MTSRARSGSTGLLGPCLMEASSEQRNHKAEKNALSGDSRRQSVKPRSLEAYSCGLTAFIHGINWPRLAAIQATSAELFRSQLPISHMLYNFPPLSSFHYSTLKRHRHYDALESLLLLRDTAATPSFRDVGPRSTQNTLYKSSTCSPTGSASAENRHLRAASRAVKTETK